MPKKEEMPVHAANGFTKTVCGIDFSKAVPCHMTNVIDDITCSDCNTILSIWEKNK